MRSTLVATLDGRVVQQMDVGAPLWTVTIGRHHSCDIVINQAVVSRRHARLVHSDDGVVIHDLGASQGVYIKGMPVDRHILRVGHVMHIGLAQIHFEHVIEHVIAGDPAPQPTGGESLLAAVLADPDNLAARQVYGDWLADRGDPRGEFIQVQIAAHGLTDGDPRRDALYARGRELLDQYEARWIAPMPVPVESWRFARGFIEQVTLGHDVDAAVATRALAGCHPVHTIENLAIDF